MSIWDSSLLFHAVSHITSQGLYPVAFRLCWRVYSSSVTKRAECQHCLSPDQGQGGCQQTQEMCPNSWLDSIPGSRLTMFVNLGPGIRSEKKRIFLIHKLCIAISSLVCFLHHTTPLSGSSFYYISSGCTCGYTTLPPPHTHSLRDEILSYLTLHFIILLSTWNRW
jgi:hypothetical protein